MPNPPYTSVSIELSSTVPFLETITAANTTANTHAAQVVKKPVFIRAASTMTGTVTITDGSGRPGWVLAKSEVMPFYCSNLNQLTYQFSVNAGTEKFSLSTGD